MATISNYITQPGGYHGKIQSSLLLALVVATTLVSAAFGQKQPDRNNDEDYVPGRILVKFGKNVPPGRVLKLVSDSQSTLEDQIEQIEVLQLKIPPGRNVEEFMSHFKQFQEVEFAEPDYWRPPTQSNPPSRTPRDPSYTSQWHLPLVSLPIAWNTTTGAADCKIAIIDTGVDQSHPDLAGKLLAGWNFYDGNADADDVFGHGTAVAGTAAAATDNNVGIAAPAWGCQILPARVSDPNGWATDSMIASALTWAADQGADVANISYAVSTSSAVTAAAQYFQSKGGVVTVSAGNDGLIITNNDNPYVLTVGATDSADVLAPWSNTGNILDLVAPGVNIYTTSNGGIYGQWTGTSFSAPLVAGVVALVKDANPSLSPSQVQNIIKLSATDLGAAGWDANHGSGRLDAAQAISLAMTADTTPPTVAITNPVGGATLAGTVGVKVSTADNIGVVSVAYQVDGTTVGIAVNPPFDFSWDTLRTAANGTRVFSAVASDAAGNQATSSITVTVTNADGTRPTVKITAPVSRSIVSGTVIVKVTATDNGMVASVSLSINSKLYQTLTKAPYEFTWDTNAMNNGMNTYPNGSYTLLAKATDGKGNYSTTSISVTVSNADTTQPTITITAPADGTKTTLSKISVTHSAVDNQKVTKVELYVDGVLKTSSTSAPFTITWSTLAGTHKLQSRALDAKLNYGWSNIVYVTK